MFVHIYTHMLCVYTDTTYQIHKKNRLQIANSKFTENDFGAFYAGVTALGAKAILRNNKIKGKLWYHKRRPRALLVEEHAVGVWQLHVLIVLIVHFFIMNLHFETPSGYGNYMS